MSQPPSFPPPTLAYDSPVLNALPLRPTSVTVIAIIVIVFSSIGLLCSPFAIIPYVMPRTGPSDQLTELMHGNTVMRVWAIGGAILGFIVAGINLYASIGSLKLKPSARRLMVTMAIVQLLIVVVNVGVIIFVMMPPMMDMIRSGDPAARAGAIGGLVGGFGGAIVGCILPGLTLYFFQTPFVVDAFERPRNLIGNPTV